MTKFEVHPAADKSFPNHAAAPRGAMDVHQHGIRTIDRMSGNPDLPILLADDFVDVILRMNFQYGAG